MSWCVNPPHESNGRAPSQMAFPARAVPPAMADVTVKPFTQQQPPLHHAPLAHAGKATSQPHFNSIWSGSQSSHSIENACFRSQAAVYGTNSKYYAVESNKENNTTRVNVNASSQDGGAARKTFADLFQSLPAAANATQNSNASQQHQQQLGAPQAMALSQQQGGPYYSAAAAVKQREDAARTSYLAKKYQGDMQSLSLRQSLLESQSHIHQGNGMHTVQEVSTNFNKANSLSQEALGYGQQHGALLQEMTSRIGTLTKMVMNINSSLDDRFSDLSGNMKSYLQGMNLIVSEKCSEVKEIARQNQYLMKLNASQQERFFAAAQQQQQQESSNIEGIEVSSHSNPKGEDSAKESSLWSREPESYLNLLQRDDGEVKPATDDDRAKVNDSAPLGADGGGGKDEASPAAAAGERETQEPAAQEASGGEGEDAEEKEIDNAMEADDDDQGSEADRLSITSEDEIEGDDDDFEDCIRKRISKYLSEK